MPLSKFFTVDELTHSDTAKRERIPNQPDAAQLECLRQLATAVLDPLREAVGAPIRVSSGYRSPALNRRIGGSPTSQHSLGQAADLQPTSISALELFKTAIRQNLPYDQIIYEDQGGGVVWVHLSHKAGANRGEIREAQFNAAGKPVAYPLISREQALAKVMPASRSLRRAVPKPFVEHADEPVAPASSVPAASAAPTKKAPATKTAAKRPVTQTVAKAGAKKVAKKAAKPVAKKAVKKAVKTTAKPTAKTTAKTVAKRVAKSAKTK